MNPLSPHHLSPLERRRELCAILARGLVRLLAGQSSEVVAEIGESSLHSAPDRSSHATATHRRNT
jgi:hypothetical protein